MSTLLFTVDGYHESKLGLTLMPGFPLQLLSHPEVKGIQQGTPIELKLPDGTRQQTMIANYCVRAPVDSDPAELASLPILLILPEDVTEEDVPVGTEVWLSTSDATLYADL